MAYSGKFVPINIGKYEGDHTNIVYRSLWEAAFMKWLDMNSDVKSWSSEEIVIPYMSPVDDRVRRYFPDFKVKFNNGEVLIVEVKPDYQTQKPVFKNGMSKTRMITEAQTYAVNWAKWKSAERYSTERGWKFAVFTEHTLNGLGIQIPTAQPKGRR